MKRITLALMLMLMLALAGPAAQMTRDPTAIFSKADTDHDGRISRAEFQAARLAKFDKMDRNGDGAISRDDFSRIIKRRPQFSQRIDFVIAEMDANRDGKVTRDEFAHAPTAIFDRADSNHDTYVDRAELAALRARIKAMRAN